MPTDMFARVGDIKGESLDSKHKGEIVVLSWAWGVTQTGSMAYGGGAGKAKFPGLRLHPSHRQGVAAADEGLRDRRAHQGRDDHGPQGW